MNDIVAGVQQYQSSLLDNLRKQVKDVVKKHSEGTTSQLENDAMDIFDIFIGPFANDATTCRQNRVEERGGSRECLIKDKEFYYVPLAKSLEQLLSHPRV